MTGIFDSTSYGLFLSAMIVMATTTWLVTPNCSFTEAALKTFGSCFNQGSFYVRQQPRRRISQAFIGMFMIYNYMVTIMYSSVVIFLLMLRREGKSIETLTDLLIEENMNVRYVRYSNLEVANNTFS